MVAWPRIFFLSLTRSFRTMRHPSALNMAYAARARAFNLSRPNLQSLASSRAWHPALDERIGQQTLQIDLRVGRRRCCHRTRSGGPACRHTRKERCTCRRNAPQYRQRKQICFAKIYFKSIKILAGVHGFVCSFRFKKTSSKTRSTHSSGTKSIVITTLSWSPRTQRSSTTESQCAACASGPNFCRSPGRWFAYSAVAASAPLMP